MTARLMDEASRRVLVFDGAMGTSLHQFDLDLQRDYLGCENCVDLLVATRPDVVQQVHESFLAVGSDAVSTDSFGGARHTLGEFGLQDRCFELNKTAAEVARAACDRFASPDRPRFVLGSMGPGTKLVTLGQITWDAMFAAYREQAGGLIAGGVDALLLETCQDLLQVKCAINACLAAIDDAARTTDDVPIMVSVTIEQQGAMLLGTSIEAAAAALAGYPIASLGLNCATGPAEMAEHVHWLGRHWDRPITVQPNAGLPSLVEGRTEYPLTPSELASSLEKFIADDGVWAVGGCCGTTPEHLRAVVEMVERLGDRGLRSRRRGVRDRAFAAAAVSLYSPVPYRQDTSFLIVGERMNASGSRKFKSLLEAEDFDGIVSLAREQVRQDGAHVLDLNVDYAGRDNAGDMAEIVSRVARQVDAPLMLDSTQVATIEAGLKRAPGKCIINSANFEDGEEKFDAVCRLARRYGAALVIGSIDEDKEASMARTADRKVAIARRGLEAAVERHGIDPRDIFFDPLVLPVSTGMESDRRSALETIEGTRRIASEMPECQTVVGLSNVSFGLKPAARVVLNSVFLHELLAAGLTSAIVHASKILPRNKIEDAAWEAALDLIYDRRRAGFDPLQAFIDLFQAAGAGGASAAEKRARTLEERLRAHIIDGEKEGLERTLDEAMEKHRPLDIINEHLLDGMRVVGELFGSGQMQLPFVLQSAEVMKKAVAYLEPHMDRVEGQSRGRIVLATVKGDVHDIGKNLVDIILSNNGFDVVNLGIKQPISNILAACQEHGADAIGLSGLLVKSVHVMEENLHEMNAAGVGIPVLLGGAALTRHYAEGHLRGIYKGECFYGKDAFEGLRLMRAIVGGKTAEIAAEIDERLGKRARAEEVSSRSRVERDVEVSKGGVAVLARSEVATDVAIPNPPFWGTRVVEAIDLDEVYTYINTVALFRGQWQFKKGKMTEEAYEVLLEREVRPLFERMKERGREFLEPRVVYGYYPCRSSGNDLIVYDAEDHEREIERFTFPRQAGKQRLCISDFFRSVESGERDVLSLQCVTMGRKVSEVTRRLFASNEYAEYLYVHGLGVESAEALAELWHKRIREELGIGGEDSREIRELFTQHYRGSRYSFGYPACPEMSDQEKLWRLLRPERIECELTENWQIDPEQSTSAIVVHHPEAKYFVV